MSISHPKWRRAASSLLRRDRTLGTHLRKGLLRDQQRLAHEGRADIAEQVQNRLRELVLGPAVVERKADMQFQLRGPPCCGVGDDADQRPGLQVEPGPRCLRKVKPFKQVDEAVVRYLSIPEIRRLVNACPEDFRKLIEAALYTGCRYAELSRLKYEDYNDDSGTLSVRLSKGKTRHVVLTDESKDAFRR